MEKQRKKTILVIDDDLGILSTITQYLIYSGYEIITATDGMEGLKKVERCEYDLVITDIVMPYVSGVGVVTAIKKKNPKIPVIAITGYGKEAATAATEKNVDLVLAKPIDMALLKVYISRLLSPKQG